MLKDANLSTLEYLFRFLDAYDFSSEGGEEVQQENKTLINASVLGLIFEKINGYKDGSFFTPGFITMYMSRETIRRAAVQKFNNAFGLDCEGFGELQNFASTRNYKKDFIQQGNELVDGLTLCDPAVGSGHFLVSALNEMLTLKSELGILADKDYSPLSVRVSVVNDELFVTDQKDDFFVYRPGVPEAQRIQETLFHEKEKLIEGCLFGVDINPNSVKICRLRLWIELLKNAYYTEESKYTELETLPNIDINIKTGNSLLYRFGLQQDLSEVFRKQKFNLQTYKTVVATYKKSRSRQEKEEFLAFIQKLKEEIKTEVSKRDPKRKKILALREQLILLDNNIDLFGQPIQDPSMVAMEKKRLTLFIEQKEQEIEAIENNELYRDAFEWRFEFPEVLNDKGEFVGFDIVIGNPPYIRIQELTQSNAEIAKHYSEKYSAAAQGNYDIYVIFNELALTLLNKNGVLSFIQPNKFFNANYGKNIRQLISKGNHVFKVVHFGAEQIFEEASTYTCLLFLSKASNEQLAFAKVDSVPDWIDNKILCKSIIADVLSKDDWTFPDPATSSLMIKLRLNSRHLEEVTDRIFQGLKTSADKIYILEKLDEDNDGIYMKCPMNDKNYTVEKELFHPLIKGGNSKGYILTHDDLYILFPYKNGSLLPENYIKSNLPQTYKYLLDHKEYLENRENGKMRGAQWYAYGRHQAVDVIASTKIFTPDISPEPAFGLDEEGEYYFTGGVSGGYGIIPKSLSKKVLIGILNSQVAAWYIRQTSTSMRGGWYSYEAKYIKSLPIPKLGDKEAIQLENYVDQIMRSREQNSNSDISLTRNKINQLVYELYGLTEEEIRLIDAGS